MRLATVLLVLCSTTPALAEDEEVELELDFAPSVALATAGVTLDSTVSQADASASAGAWIDGNAEWRYRNSYAFARGQAAASLRAGSDGAGLTFAQDAQLRPYAFEVFQFTFSDRVAFDVAPKLSERPDRWRRRYRAAGFDVPLPHSAPVATVQIVAQTFPAPRFLQASPARQSLWDTHASPFALLPAVSHPGPSASYAER